eukprot:scaffold25477_cov60-Phaeocystis_antarctica.AAC.2
MAQTRGGCLARLLPRGRLVRTASRKSGQPIAVRDVVSTEPRKRHVAGLRVAELAAELRKRNTAVAVARPQVGRVLERLSRLAVAVSKYVPKTVSRATRLALTHSLTNLLTLRLRKVSAKSSRCAPPSSGGKLAVPACIVRMSKNAASPALSIE